MSEPSFVACVLLAMFPGLDKGSLRTYLWEHEHIHRLVLRWHDAACWEHDELAACHRAAHDAIYEVVGRFVFQPVGDLETLDPKE